MGFGNKRASKRELDECRVGVEKKNTLDDKVKTKVHEGKTTYLSCLDYGPPLYVLVVHTHIHSTVILGGAGLSVF